MLVAARERQPSTVLQAVEVLVAVGPKLTEQPTLVAAAAGAVMTALLGLSTAAQA
jgi:hypothetical protein